MTVNTKNLIPTTIIIPVDV